jgi:hypothetical protein
MGTTLRVGSVLITGADSDPGMAITFHASAPIGQAGIAVYDFLNSPIWGTYNSSNPVNRVFGDYWRGSNTNSATVGPYGRNVSSLFGTANTMNPAGMTFPTGKGDNSRGPRITGGSGIPGVFAAVVGDIWFRSDTPGTANQMAYQCTTASTAARTVSGATWSGGTATITTSAAHGFTATTQKVIIYEVTPSGYNGEYVIASTPTSTTFTVAIAGDPGAFSSGGLAVNGGAWTARL